MVSHAQEDVFSLGNGILNLFNNYIIPVLISLAVLFFVGNVIRYFIVESDDTDSRAIARQFGMYGILALVFIVAFWGIVNFFVVSFGFVENDDGCHPIPDWIGDERCGEGPDVVSDLGSSGALGDDSGTGGSDFDAEIGGSDDTQPNTTPPESPTSPDGGSGDLPNIGDPPPASQGDLLAAQQDVVDEIGDFFAELRDSESIFGSAGTILEDAGIFADLDDFSDDNNDLERLQAAYRLNQMGELGDAEYANLVSHTNNYRDETGLNPISDSNIEDNIAVPETEWPSELTSERDALITERVAEYNADPLVDDIDVANIEFLLTSPARSLDERYDNFNQLYDDNSLNALMTDDFVDDYLGYLNAEAALQGERLDDLY